MQPEDAGVFQESGSHVSARLAPPRKLALLKEWHASLTAIVARQPDAFETRRTIAAIERQIDELNSEKISKPLEPDRAAGVYCP